MGNLDVQGILGYGVIGLGFLLALLAFRILSTEQKREVERPRILYSAYAFMAFSIFIVAAGLVSEFMDFGGSGPVDEPYQEEESGGEFAAIPEIAQTPDVTMPDVMQLTVADMAYYREACDAYGEAGSPGGYSREEVEEAYPGIAEDAACGWEFAALSSEEWDALNAAVEARSRWVDEANAKFIDAAQKLDMQNENGGSGGNSVFVANVGDAPEVFLPQPESVTAEAMGGFVDVCIAYQNAVTKEDLMAIAAENPDYPDEASACEAGYEVAHPDAWMAFEAALDTQNRWIADMLEAFDFMRSKLGLNEE